MTESTAASRPTPGAEGLLVLHVITGLGDGGAEGALYRLCKFDRVNRHVVVSLMDGGKHAAPLEHLGVPVHCLGMQRGRFSLRAAAQLWRLVRSYRPDVLQSWLYHADLIGGVVGRLAGVPQVVWGIRHADLEPDIVKRSTIAVARLAASLSRIVPAKIVCCSHVAKRVHVELGYDERKFFVIPNGYDLTSLAPDETAGRRFRVELGVPDDLPLLGMVSRFDPLKDHANLLGALAIVAARGTDFRCALIGTGMSDDNAALRALISKWQLQDRVLLLGRRDDIPDVMNGLDLHLLSSASEAFPNVLAEAMACGTPCVATDVGDATLIVEAWGWIVPPGDSAAFAQAIIQALGARGDLATWHDRQAGGRTHIMSNFAIDKMVAAYGACWNAPFRGRSPR